MLPSRSTNILWIVLFFYPTLLMILVGFHVCLSTETDTVTAPPEVAENNGTLYAACKMTPNTVLPKDLPEVNGHVLFKQQYPQGTLKVLFNLNGFPSDESPESQSRAIHIHQYGDLSQGCQSTGGHYNPLKVSHPSHPGDFGNFVAVQGRIHKMIDCEATLFGELSALGRAVVIHEKVDDLGRGGDSGSLLHGNAGRRVACCVVGIASPSLWNRFSEQIQVETDNTSSPQK